MIRQRKQFRLPNEREKKNEFNRTTPVEQLNDINTRSFLITLTYQFVSEPKASPCLILIKSYSYD